MAKNRFLIFYHDKKTPQLKSRVFTKDGIVVTFDSLVEAEKVAKKLRATYSNVEVSPENGSPKKAKPPKKTKGTTKPVVPSTTLSKKEIGQMAGAILKLLRTGHFHAKGED